MLVITAIVHAAGALTRASGTPFTCSVFVPQLLCAFRGLSKLAAGVAPQVKLKEPEELKACLCPKTAPAYWYGCTKVHLLLFPILLPGPTLSLVFCHLYHIFGSSFAFGRTNPMTTPRWLISS